jgi:reactive intermediate/imine deaminase
MNAYNEVLARNTEKAPKIGHYSQTAAFSHYNNLSAQLPVDPKTGSLVSGGIKEQTEQCLKNILAVLESIGHSLTDVVRLTIFVKNIKDIDVVNTVYKSFFIGYLPTRTIAEVAALPLNALVQMEALITNAEGTIPNAAQTANLIKLTNNSSKAPVDLFSTQTIAFSHYNNLSMQLPINPKTGRLVAGGIEEQTTQCLQNIKTILESIDVPFDDIVKTTIFVTNLDNINAINKVYTQFFPDSSIARAAAYMPARTIVPVNALSQDALVAIEAVVSHGDGTPPQAVEDRHGIVIWAKNTDKVPTNAFSTQTVAFSHYNHLSAQLPLDAAGKKISGGIKEQAEQCFKNLKTIAESIGHSLADTVKVNAYLKNISDIEAFTEVYKKFFPEGKPAGKIVGVTALMEDALVQVDIILGNAEGTPRKV